MKSHELAKSLVHLSRVLKAGPNVEVSSIGNLDMLVVSERSKPVSAGIGNRAAALALLATMSKYNKKEWVSVVRELELPIEIKLTDSVRDLVGRILKYIAESSDAQEKILRKAGQAGSEASPELMRALTILLK